MSYLLFMLLGLGAGSVYAALGLSLVVTYRSSGVINFSAPALATYGAYTYAYLRSSGGYFIPVPGLPEFISLGGPLPLGPAFALAAASTGLLGLIMYWLVFRWMINALPIARIVASLGVMIVIEAVIGIRLGTGAMLVGDIFPPAIWRVGGLGIPVNRIYLTLTIVCVATAMWALSRYTSFGLKTRAVADNNRAAGLVGISPHLIASANWVLGAVVAGCSGILIAPILPLTPGGYTFFIVSALAAALVGGFAKLAPAVATGLVIGIAQSEITKLQTFSWFPQGDIGDAIPVVLIIIVLFARSRAIPERAALFKQVLPSSPRPRAILSQAVAGLVVLVGVSALVNQQYRAGFMTSMTFAILALSWVVVAGYGGQISLAQLSLAGVSAFTVSSLSTDFNLPFIVAVLAGAVAAVIAGLIFGLPAIRIRGMSLAIVTLGAAVAIQSMWFNNINYTGGPQGARVRSPSFFGIDIGVGSGASYPRLSYAVVLAIALVIVCLFVASVRRSRLGGQMLAVRANDRAAAAGGLNVTVVKLISFGLGALIAGLAGGLMAYQSGSVSEPSFDVFLGLSFFAVIYLCGITSITGALMAGVAAPGGIFFVVLSEHVSVGGYYSLVTGLLLIDAAIRYPEGISGALRHIANRIAGHSRGGHDVHETRSPAPEPVPMAPAKP
jgi:branched-subunit amino acid ABC-type transport system permease component